MINPMQMPANQGITNRAASDKSVPKDLIELLRLAKLQREQQAAARAQALNAPQTPTVKEQLEEATGIARMAQGGMVPGYANGGRITSMEDIDAIRNSRMNMDRSPEIEPELVEGLRDFSNERMNMDRSPSMPEDEFGEFSPEIAGALKKLRNERMSMDRSPSMAQGGIVPSYKEGGEITDENSEATVEDPSTGEMITKLGGDALNWAKENPVEALATGLMFIPGIGWGASVGIRGLGLAYRGLKGIDYAKKGKQAVELAKVGGRNVLQGGKNVAEIGKKGFTKPGPTQYPLKRDPKTGRMLPSTAREFSLGRTAAVGGPLSGAGIEGLDALFSMEDSDEADSTEEIKQILESGAGGAEIGGSGDESSTVEEGGSGDESSTVEEGGSGGAVDEILKGVATGEINPTDEVNPTDMDSLIQSILNPAPMGDYAKDNKFEPESQSKLQTLADFLIGGAGTSNIGTTLANAAENMGKEADKDEAKQIAADNLAYTKAKGDRDDTFARKSLAVEARIKQEDIAADRAVQMALKDAQMLPAAVQAIGKIETGINKDWQEYQQLNNDIMQMEAKVKSGDLNPNDPKYQKEGREFLANFNRVTAARLASLQRYAEMLGMPLPENQFTLVGINSADSGGGDGFGATLKTRE